MDLLTLDIGSNNITYCVARLNNGFPQIISWNMIQVYKYREQYKNFKYFLKKTFKNIFQSNNIRTVVIKTLPITNTNSIHITNMYRIVLNLINLNGHCAYFCDIHQILSSYFIINPYDSYNNIAKYLAYNLLPYCNIGEDMTYYYHNIYKKNGLATTFMLAYNLLLYQFSYHIYLCHKIIKDDSKFVKLC